MKKSSGWLGWAAFGILAVIVILSRMFGNPTEGVPVPPDQVKVGSIPTPTPSPSATTAVVGRSSTMTGRDPQGNTTWILRASTLTLRDEDKKALARDVHCTFFGKDRKAVATLTAGGAVMNTRTLDLDFEGEVNITTPVGEHLTVQKLRYDGKQKKFFGKDGVRLTRGTSVLTGDTLVADPTMKIVTVKGNVRADIRSLAVNSPAPSGSPPEP